MVLINVNNLKRKREGIRCDRLSILGNPFYMRHEGERERVIKAFEEYFYECLNSPPNYIVSLQSIADNHNVVVAYNWKPLKAGDIQQSIKTLLDQLIISKQITLLCWCKPKDCHLDIVKDYLLSQYSKTLE